MSILKFFVTILLFAGFLNAHSQDTLSHISYDFSEPQQYSTWPGSKFKVEGKDGKLYFTQKGSKPENWSPGLFANSNSTKYYNVDIRFDLKFLDTNPESILGLSVSTYDGGGNAGYQSVTEFALTPEGKIKYYSGKLIDDYQVMKQPAEPCASFKPGQVNQVALIRNAHFWYVLVNGDTAKQSYELKLEPIMNLFSGQFELAGKCKAEIDNFTFASLSDIDITARYHAKMKGLSGSYIFYSSCLQAESKRVTLQFSQIGKTSRFSLVGLDKNPVEFYLEEIKENVFRYDGNLNVIVDGQAYILRKFLLTYDKDKNRHNMSFNVYGDTPKGRRDCDFDGDK
jgi:hypothetical protein